MLGILFISILLVGLGLLQFLAPDLIWAWQERSNRMAGRASERTGTWENGRVISGILLILIGGALGVWAISAGSQPDPLQASLAATQVAVSTESASQLALLDAAISPVINTLLEQASAAPRRMRARDLGINLPANPEIDFGRCESDNTFYLYVVDLGSDRDAFTYSAGSLCRHPVLSFNDALIIGQSTMGGTWRIIRFLQDNSAIATAAFAPLATIQAAPTVTPLDN